MQSSVATKNKHNQLDFCSIITELSVIYLARNIFVGQTYN